ncbi:MAG TPA: leucyl aminopeptidase [Streptosporangiaceae bacterium]|nr:leucyl aminopeptidase [Streptosporangiaceae bacterium]
MTATLRTSPSAARDVSADAIVIAIGQGDGGPVLAPGAGDVDAALGGGLLETLAALGATGKAEEVTKTVSAGKLSAPLIAAVGIGTASAANSGSADAEVLRRAAGAAVRSLRSPTIRTIALALPAGDPASAEATALGALLGGYHFGRYRTNGHPAAELTLVTGDDPAVAAAVSKAQVLAAAVTLVRDLVNTSPSHLYPESFAEQAGQIAAAAGLGYDVLDEAALADGGYGGITGVGQGSVHPPRLVRLSYQHPDASRTVVFAGKGITFDSGGLSLKPPKAMEAMKSDMGGAAAVLAALQAIAALKPAVNVVGYLPLAENMPGSGAQRPSDVITIYGGTTVEVLNTDAEGRLVLADALARSEADQPDLLVDIATLTGAQVVALGTRVSAVMANDEDVRDGVVDAATRAGEAMWPMPLPEELRKGLDSKVADLANVAGDRDGGMLVAGLFLREFVPDGVRWAHLDIAGPSFHEGEPYGYTAKGGTGAATRTLVQIAQDVADGRL